MIYLSEIAYKSFIVVRSSIPPEQLHSLVDNLKITHVIVHRMDGGDSYYLFGKEEVAALLENVLQKSSLTLALDLEKRNPTPVLDRYSDAENAPKHAIVLDDHHVIGFIDDTLDPNAIPESNGAGTRDGGGMEFSGGLRSFGIESFETSAPVSRSFVTEFPDRVHLGTSVVLKVALSADVDQAGLTVAKPLGAEILVVVEPGMGFKMDGPSEGKLVVTGEHETLPLRFKLKATAIGTGKLQVYAYSGVQPLGVMEVAAAIVSPDEDLELNTATREHSLSRLQEVSPDLVLLVFQHSEDTQLKFTMRLLAKDPNVGHDFGSFGPVEVKKSPAQYFQDFFASIVNKPLENPEQRKSVQVWLESRGVHLFKSLFPLDLQTLIWSLRNRIKTVQIRSNEPWIPWELCRLRGEVDGSIQTGKFLCEAFEVTRWLPKLGAKTELSLNKMAIVAPDDTGLYSVPQERDHLLSLSTNGRQVERIPARFLDVYNSLCKGIYNGWHFTGHGYVSESDLNNSGLQLEDLPFSPENLSGEAENLGRAEPLVFLNACDVGRRYLDLTHMGGFAENFLRANASAFLGTLWAIDDEIAFEFSKAMYERLLDRKQPIGQAMRESRLQIRDAYPGDPTWLAYTLFADPLAVVKSESG